MKRRYAAAVLMGLSAIAGTAEANWFTTFWKNVHRDYRRNNCWPEPFVYDDREAVKAPFGVMIAKGWRSQNTLMDHHFSMETGALNESGRLKMKTIMWHTPAAHRAVYVVRGANQDVTSSRLDAVQEMVVAMNTQGDLPPVLEVDYGPTAWPADYVDAVGKRYQNSMKDPRLPEADDGGEDQ
ncbi:MAG: hypothetical protein SGJ19_29085 [Planctomycetia bacterium]|nr:hypothetical protein [Planctomycetia bacterium]